MSATASPAGTTAAPPTESRRRGRLADAFVGIWGTLRALVRRVLVEPVRTGRLRATAWPSGLLPVAVVGLAAIGLAIVLVLWSGLLRAIVPLTMLGLGDPIAMPRALDWVLFSLTTLALALAMTGAMHARAWLRWTITGFIVLVILFMAGLGTGEASGARAVTIVGALLLIGYVAVRGGRGFRWWDFVVVGGVVGGSITISIGLVTAASWRFGFDFGPSMLVVALTTLGTLATPSAVAAGAAMVEITVATASWSVGEVRRRIGLGAVVVVLVLALVWRGVDLAELGATVAVDPTPWIAYALWSAALLVAIGGGMLLLRRIAPAGARPSLHGVLGDLGGVALPISALLTINVAATVLAILSVVLSSSGVPPAVTEWLDAVYAALVGDVAFRVAMTATGAGAVVAGIVLTRRGRASIGTLLLAIGVSTLMLWVGQLVELPQRGLDDAIAALITVLGVAVVVLAIARRSATSLVAGTTVVVIAALFAHREVLSDPVAAVIGTAGAGAVLFGQVWGFLTGSAAANADSPRYPRPARVLLVLGSTLFAITLLATSALWRDTAGIIPFDRLARVGDAIFGNAIVIVAALVAVRAAIRGREIDEG